MSKMYERTLDKNERNSQYVITVKRDIFAQYLLYARGRVLFRPVFYILKENVKLRLFQFAQCQKGENKTGEQNLFMKTVKWLMYEYCNELYLRFIIVSIIFLLL